MQSFVYLLSNFYDMRNVIEILSQYVYRKHQYSL